MEDPNDGEMFARWTTTDPPFFASVHQFQYDRLRRVIYDKGEYYEMSLTSIFSSILKDAPANSRVIDVGGNIGWFSMVSAAHGHHVDVFEPNKANILRICESKLLNHWGNVASIDLVSPQSRLVKRGTIDIRPYGVGANETTLKLFVGENPGKATFLRTMLPKWRAPKEKSIKIIPLDMMAREMKWFDRPTPIIILKVDAEGLEPQVFSGAKRLLLSGFVENIIMEISAQPNDDGNKANAWMLRLLVDSGYRVHQVANKPDLEIPPPDKDFAKRFIHLYANKQGMQINIWWKRKDDIRKWKGKIDAGTSN